MPIICDISLFNGILSTFMKCNFISRVSFFSALPLIKILFFYGKKSIKKEYQHLIFPCLKKYFVLLRSPLPSILIRFVYENCLNPFTETCPCFIFLIHIKITYYLFYFCSANIYNTASLVSYVHVVSTKRLPPS